MNLVRRIRLRILAIRIRLLNISIAIIAIRRFILGRRIDRRVYRSDVLGKRYRDLEGTIE